MKTQTTALALSIRQPWAWLIIHGGKNIENRTWPTRVRGRILIHASQTMTRSEYALCLNFCCRMTLGIIPTGLRFPSYSELLKQCGGIVGEMDITDCVTEHPSRWFAGPHGFVIRSAYALPFQPCKGRLGFFRIDPPVS